MTTFHRETDAAVFSRYGRPDRPVTMPSEHARLIDGWRPGGRWNRVVHALDASGRLDGDPDVYSAFELATLLGASLWWVSAEMCAVLEAAMRQLPRSTSLVDGTLLDTSGFCMFATPMMLTAADTGMRDLTVDAVSWGPLHMVDGFDFEGPGIGISSYTWHDHLGSSPLGRSEWVLGHKLRDFIPGQQRRGPAYCAAAAEDRSLLAAVALLARQENIAQVATVLPDRAGQRRAVRAGRSPEVRVIRLHPRHSTQGSGSGSMSVRTLVSGHWRSQPCGPARSLRKPVWIAPHLRGPEDAPLVVRPTVRVV